MRLWSIYYRSDDWQKLAADTKKNRRRVIERFRAKHGDKRVALLQREHILGMLAAIERPSAKRHWLKAIRGLLRAAVPDPIGKCRFLNDLAVGAEHDRTLAAADANLGELPPLPRPLRKGDPQIGRAHV